MKEPIRRIMILGPTASGKTDLACRLAQRIDGEIISVDSRQCYRRIDIGTAKPNTRQLNSVPHHNISLLGPEETDSVASFLKRAETWQNEILSRGRKVIYCGGSTLHLKALLQPLDSLPAANPDHLKQLEKRAEKEGLESLYNQLLEVDPESAERMDGLNRHRIYRALDVWMQTGKPISSFHNQPDTPIPPEGLQVFGLSLPRRTLHHRIEQRVDRMIEEGLVNETRQLLSEGYKPSQQFLQTVGYRNVIEHLHGELSFEQMIKDIKTSTRRYAKRQITWFRRWPFIHWLDAELPPEENIRSIYSKLNEPNHA